MLNHSSVRKVQKNTLHLASRFFNFKNVRRSTIRSSICSTFAATLFVFSAPSTADGLKVVELFTSQGCYSCPAADKLVNEMAQKDPSILNLEFHVDYWNDLQYRSEGNWEDPYSSAEYSVRQQRYNVRKLEGRNGVYTPQAVINGVYGTVGSNARGMRKGLTRSHDLPISVAVAKQADGMLSVSLEGSARDADAQVYLVSFLRKTVTNVTSGENHDKVMENHNVVIDFEPIGDLMSLESKPVQVAFAGGDNLDCAVLVQLSNQGPMIGAARCP